MYEETVLPERYHQSLRELALKRCRRDAQIGLVLAGLGFVSSALGLLLGIVPGLVGAWYAYRSVRSAKAAGKPHPWRDPWVVAAIVLACLSALISVFAAGLLVLALLVLFGLRLAFLVP